MAWMLLLLLLLSAVAATNAGTLSVHSYKIARLTQQLFNLIITFPHITKSLDMLLSSPLKPCKVNVFRALPENCEIDHSSRHTQTKSVELCGL